MTQDELKQAVARAALAYVPVGRIIGVGTGSTARLFIEALAEMKDKIVGAVASSEDSRQRLEAHGIKVFDLNDVTDLPIYIDGADEINAQMHMVKGGGRALTREKIVSAVAQQFICIADESKRVDVLGQFPLPIEVIPMARAYVARELSNMGGTPLLRADCVTDNGNLILDVSGLHILDPVGLEAQLNQIVGVVTNGLFAERGADVLLLAGADGVERLQAR